MRRFLSGVIFGVMIVGTAIATNIVVNKTTSPIVINGETVEFDAFNINGYNYFKIKDLGEKLNFSVVWDESERKVLIDTSKPYEKQEDNQDNGQKENIIKVPQTDESFCPPIGTVIETEIFKNGEFTGEKSTLTVLKVKPEEPELPKPTCDWSKFPEVELPKAVAKDFGNGRVSIINIHETRRMQYTLYNLFATSEYTWENGTLARYKSGKYKTTVSFELIGPDEKIQVMWPWRASELEKVFIGCPMGTWRVIAYDEYVNGKFTHTAYYLQN